MQNTSKNETNIFTWKKGNFYMSFSRECGNHSLFKRDSPKRKLIFLNFKLPNIAFENAKHFKKETNISTWKKKWYFHMVPHYSCVRDHVEISFFQSGNISSLRKILWHSSKSNAISYIFFYLSYTSNIVLQNLIL